jgi:hypothetical protein
VFTLVLTGALALVAVVISRDASYVARAATTPRAATAVVSSAPKPAKMLRGTGIVRWGELPSTPLGHERFSYVLVSRQAARFASRSPGRSLVYMSGTSVQQLWSTGVSYSQAVAGDWLLRDLTGAPLKNTQYGAFIADVGSRSYQQRFVDNVTKFVRSTGVDGIFLDDVVANPYLMTGGTYPAKYPSQGAWEDAIVSFVTNVGSALKANGVYVLANASKFVPGDAQSDTGEATRDFWQRLTPGVSGLMVEFWLQTAADTTQLRGVGARWFENWQGWQGLISFAQRAGVDFFGLGYGLSSNTRAMRFLRASFLLDWNGRGGALIYQTTDRADPYHPAWVKQPGAAVAGKSEPQPGVWLRRFTNAIVVVNASDEAVQLQVGGVRHVVPATDAVFVRPARR